jgi:hypothetical protein
MDGKDAFTAGLEASVGPEVIAFIRTMVPNLLDYLERRRADRRHAFDLAFAAAETHEEKTDLAMAFLEGSGTDVTDFVAAAAKKAGVAPS